MRVSHPAATSENDMAHIEPSILNQLQLYRPPCPRCGSNTMLARIEPAELPGYDLRTFECRDCGHMHVLAIQYRA
jgi:predicted RNA-binding Zn-ribbon protein involved in translation (DUF1610 family)